MAHCNKIPFPLEHYDRLDIGRSLHILVNGIAPPSLTLDVAYMAIRDDEPFETKKLLSKADSFYRSLSMWIFGNETDHTLIHKAALKHVKSNRAFFDRILTEQCRSGPECLNAYDCMKTAAKSYAQASDIDVYVAAHLMRTAIYLHYDNQGARLFSPNIEGSGKHSSRDAIFLAAKSTGDGYTFEFSPVVAYDRRLKSTEGDTTTDDRSSVTIVARDKHSTVVIPYPVAKRASLNLVEFCGEAIRTDMSIETLRRLKTFLVAGKKSGVVIDHEIFMFARRWCIDC